MDFDKIVLIDKDKENFFDYEFRIDIEKCFENIESFYKENDKIFLVLNLENDYEDDEFYKIMNDFPYDDFELLGTQVYPKDDEYYPTFIFEFECDSREETQDKVNSILDLFMEKVVKIYCNNM